MTGKVRRAGGAPPPPPPPIPTASKPAVQIPAPPPKDAKPSSVTKDVAPKTTHVPPPRVVEPLDPVVIDQIAALLSAKPLARDYKAQVRKLLAPYAPDVRLRMGNALIQRGLYLPNLTKGAPAVEDATSRIRFSYMTMSGSLFQNDYVADMLQVASKEDFRVVLQLETGITKEDALKTLTRLLRDRGEKDPAKLLKDRVQFVADKAMDGAGIWAEDNKWASGGDDDDPGVITTLPKLDHQIIRDAEHFARSYEPVDRGFQGAVDARDQNVNARTIAGALGRDVKTLRGYNEGGNMLVGTRPDGEAYAILGNDSLVISAMMLLDKKAPEIAAKRKTMREPSKEELAKVQYALNAAHRKDNPRDFIAAQAVAADQFAEDLHIAPKNLCFVSQPEFHIDMFMRPVAPGVVMIQDDQACIDMLDEAIVKAEASKSWQLPELKAMRKRSVALLAKRGALVAKIKQQLQASGIRVISAPGVMEGASRKANFMNAVPGSSVGPSGGHYYATNASSLSLLQDGFTAFLKKNGFDRVYFIGGAGGTKDTKSSSEYSLDAEGGLDCLENHHDSLHAVAKPPEAREA